MAAHGSGNLLTGGLNLGKRWFLFDRFLLGLRLGYGYTVTDLHWSPEVTLGEEGLLLSGVRLLMGFDAELSLGFAF